MSAARQKGTLAETAAVRWLRSRGFNVERRALHGSGDKGDIAGVPNWTIEVKNVRTVNYQGWVREAEKERANTGDDYCVVLHKPHGVSVDRPDEWVAVMPARIWAEVVARLENK